MHTEVLTKEGDCCGGDLRSSGLDRGQVFMLMV